MKRNINVPVHGERILHPKLETVANDIELMFTTGANANFLVVCGPTGVGKSTLGHFLVEREHERSAKEMQENPGLVPAIRIEAPSSGEKEFSWRSFFIRILVALEGNLGLPRSASGLDWSTGLAARPIGPKGNRLSDLREAALSSLRARGVKFVVVDEAVHIMMQSDPKKLETQFNTLKSLSNECDVQWILLGSYDLYDLAVLSGQLARRTYVSHFQRYLISDESDYLAFRACINELALDIPDLVPLATELQTYAEILMKNTLGCVGTLRTALIRLNALIQRDGWSPKLLERALLTQAQQIQITKEILHGEVMIQPGVTVALEGATDESSMSRHA